MRPSDSSGDCESARASVQQYIGGVVCQEEDLLRPKLLKAQAGDLPYQDTVELIQRLIDQDQKEETSCQEILDQLDDALNKASALLGKAQEAQKVKEKLEQTRRDREELAAQAETAQKALEAAQETMPHQENLGKELAALEAELPRYQELSKQESVLTALAERISELEKNCIQQENERIASEHLLQEWKQELNGLSSVDAERERLLRERDLVESRQTALTALKAQIEQWQACLQKIDAEQRQHAELAQQQAELTARLAEEREILRANQETFHASAGLSGEKLELLHHQEQVQKRQQALSDLLCELDEYDEAELSLQAARQTTNKPESGPSSWGKRTAGKTALF